MKLKIFATLFILIIALFLLSQFAKRKTYATITNYNECARAGGEISMIGLGGGCYIYGKFFNAPDPRLLPREIRCGDVICVKVNGKFQPK